MGLFYGHHYPSLSGSHWYKNSGVAFEAFVWNVLFRR
jgi:hypothetical protein